MASDKLKAVDLKGKSEKELAILLEERNQELMNLRFQAAVARLEKPSRIKTLKRDRARILTVIKEKKQA